jgi:hypothetical protein
MAFFKFSKFELHIICYSNLNCSYFFGYLSWLVTLLDYWNSNLFFSVALRSAVLKSTLFPRMWATYILVIISRATFSSKYLMNAKPLFEFVTGSLIIWHSLTSPYCPKNVFNYFSFMDWSIPPINILSLKLIYASLLSF